MTPHNERVEETVAQLMSSWSPFDLQHRSEYEKVENELRTALQTYGAECEARGRDEGASVEHQFFLNILDGIDIADGQCNTQAIRFALKSRTLSAINTDV